MWARQHALTYLGLILGQSLLIDAFICLIFCLTITGHVNGRQRFCTVPRMMGPTDVSYASHAKDSMFDTVARTLSLLDAASCLWLREIDGSFESNSPRTCFGHLLNKVNYFLVNTVFRGWTPVPITPFWCKLKFLCLTAPNTGNWLKLCHDVPERSWHVRFDGGRKQRASSFSEKERSHSHCARRCLPHSFL